MLSVHVVSYARDQGIRLEAASLAITAYGFGAVLGRVGGGLLADRFGATWIMGWGSVLQAATLTALLFGLSQERLLLLLALFGVAFAGADTAFARAVPEVFGLHALGAVFGVLSLWWRCGAALGPMTAGFIHDATGSYTIPFATAPLAVLVSLGLFVVAVRPSPHIR
jgi:MFS family permease